MASTRQPRPMQNFHDPSPPPYHFPPISKPKPQLQPSAMPLQPLKNTVINPDVILDPPMSAPQQPSPLKAATRPSPPTLSHVDFSQISIPPPTMKQVFTDSPIKRPLMPHVRPQTQPTIQPPNVLFTTFQSNSMGVYDKENYRPIASHSDNFADFPDPSYLRRPPLKGSMSEAVPMSNEPAKKPPFDDAGMTYIPEPHEMPPIDDNGDKPIYSYAQMIAMAILRAPERRLTLNQIYTWISDTFAFYRQGATGWQNSIRHNLSLNKSFQKQERPKGDAGKGSYWFIIPGQEMQFIKDKTRKGNANMNIQTQAIRPDAPQMLANALAPAPWVIQSGPVRPPEPVIVPELPELSSDATIPASDPALLDGELADFGNPSQPGDSLSSPPQAMNSSPPIVGPTRRRGNTSPVPQPVHPSSSGQGRKRRFTAMDDSGYFSSLESSAFRPNKSGIVLTSELNVEPLHKKRRGRAEAEIARIRSSSHDLTPSHLRHRSLGTDELMSSSPLRPDKADRLNPATPSIVFKKPARPPPSISPNTNLRNHRKRIEELVDSPVKSFGLHGTDYSSWSPAFKWPDSATHDLYQDVFEVFSDTAETNLSTPALDSPLKRSVQRPSLARATTTANILSDVTNSASKLNTKTPLRGPVLKPSSRAMTPGTSPSKRDMSNPIILLDQEELFDFGSFADENLDEGDGVDILKGFQKIGGAAMKAPSPNKKKKSINRPALGSRSFTSQS